MKAIASSFFGRLFGAATVIKVNNVGISIDLDRGSDQRLNIIQWTALIEPPRFSLGFLGQIIAFKTADNEYCFSMLAYNTPRQQQGDCERFWVEANIERVNKLLTTINKITTHRYLRQSTIEQIERAVKPECKRWFSWLNAKQLSRLNRLSQLSELGLSLTEKLQLLSTYQQWSEQGIAECRERYINQQLQTHKTFFDQVESNPLTLHQRRACIIDNDNNLLLAGAGTGKTSVMVGRAGYLLNSSQAQSHEILLLAYGRQAAEEMDERIKNKLSTPKVKASTFHSLGLNIIAQVEGKQPKLSIFAQNEQAKIQWIITYFEKLITEQATYRALIVEYFSLAHQSNPIYNGDTLEQSGFDFKSNQVKALGKKLANLVGLYKAACAGSNSANSLASTVNNNGITAQIIANSTDSTQNSKVLALSFALLNPILIAYQHQLTAHDEIDFEDMINNALTYVQTGQFQSPWRYIMVDEFQDISAPRARLVKALRDNNQDCSVFAVGDDWQAIYRFSGADINLTTNFADYFGATTQSVLDVTFRFNNHIGQVATDFISKNPAQVNKTIHSLKQVNEPAVSLLHRSHGPLQASKKMIVAEMANGAIDEVLTAISVKVAKEETKPVTVYLLARFWFLLPDNTALKTLNNQYPALTISCQSFHASKGKEADYVIVIGLKKGAYGFPAEKTAPVPLETLTEVLLAPKETFAHAEERRLFYVGLTRAKDKVYIIADINKASSFVNELVDEHSIGNSIEFNELKRIVT